LIPDRHPQAFVRWLYIGDVQGDQLRPTKCPAKAFHWQIEFPHIFSRGGFDVVIGNPPWERIKLQEQEFFASRSPEIATAPNKAARERLIKALANAAPDTPAARLLADFEIATRLPAFCSK